MKKIVLGLLSVTMLLLIPFNVFANGSVSDIQTANEYVEYYDDGSYAVVELVESEISTMATGVLKSKTYTYYSANDKIQFTLTVSGNFSYNGKTATCTRSNTSYKIYDDDWKVTFSGSSRSGATAKGTFTVKRYFLGIPTTTIERTVTLTCSKDGKFS